MVNKPLIRPISGRGGVRLGAGWLSSHNLIKLENCYIDSLDLIHPFTLLRNNGPAMSWVLDEPVHTKHILRNWIP